MRIPRKRARLSSPIIIIAIPITIIIVILSLYTAYSLYYRKLVYSLDTVPSMSVAIVFGAGIWPDGSLSDILADRVDTAIELYRQGKVRKLLFTGDNRYLNYNEPQRMADYAIERGVPESDIVLDYAGRRTYDSCYRARYIFEVDNAILVTQAYHLPRALFSADRMGIHVVGVAADRHQYINITNYSLRELLATPVAWWEVLISHPLPVLGPTLPIFPPQ
jgi:SanA protein